MPINTAPRGGSCDVPFHHSAYVVHRANHKVNTVHTITLDTNTSVPSQKSRKFIPMKFYLNEKKGVDSIVINGLECKETVLS